MAAPKPIRAMTHDRIKIFTGNANPALTREICSSLGLSLAEIGLHASVAEQVGRLAALTESAGLDGVVASPQEIEIIRRRCGRDFAIVTPGIRGTGEKLGDQSRTLSAADALSAGATYLVVGRPIIAAPDPRAAAERIADDCRGAHAS